MIQPAFFSVSGSTEGPGVPETVFFDRAVCAYKLGAQIKPGYRFVIEYVSAAITRGSHPWPEGDTNLYGCVGFRLAPTSTGSTPDEINAGLLNEAFHFLPFRPSEPSGLLIASQGLHLSCPSGREIVVMVPLIPGQSGGAKINVSGYFTSAS